MKLSINGGTPIAGWFSSWKLLLNEMDKKWNAII
jgi:hypothetical protein